MENRNFVHFDEDRTILKILSDINPVLKRMVSERSFLYSRKNSTVKMENIVPYNENQWIHFKQGTKKSMFMIKFHFPISIFLISYVIFWRMCKGQLISECLFCVLNFTKNQRKFWQISAPETKKWSDQQSKGTFI